jgi:hypothetical protein
MSLLLERDQLRSLANLGIQAEADDLQRAYCFTHPLIHEVELCYFEPKKSGAEWQVQLLGWDGQPLLESPVIRRIKVNAHLVGHRRGQVGRIAISDLFRLRTDAQRKGIATLVYGRESALYRSFGITQIQMVAVEAGRGVWIKPEFGFRFTDPGQIALLYDEWSDGGSAPELESEYPPAFLATLGTLRLHKDLEA